MSYQLDNLYLHLAPLLASTVAPLLPFTVRQRVDDRLELHFLCVSNMGWIGYWKIVCHCYGVKK